MRRYCMCRALFRPHAPPTHSLQLGRAMDGHCRGVTRRAGRRCVLPQSPAGVLGAASGALVVMRVSIHVAAPGHPRSAPKAPAGDGGSARRKRRATPSGRSHRRGVGSSEAVDAAVSRLMRAYVGDEKRSVDQVGGVCGNVSSVPDRSSREARSYIRKCEPPGDARAYVRAPLAEQEQGRRLKRGPSSSTRDSDSGHHEEDTSEIVVPTRSESGMLSSAVLRRALRTNNVDLDLALMRSAEETATRGGGVIEGGSPTHQADPDERRERRLRRQEELGANRMHPCMLQESGGCRSRARCPFVHLPPHYCLEKLKYGVCARQERFGNCPWSHADLSTTRVAPNVMDAVDADDGVPLCSKHLGSSGTGNFSPPQLFAAMESILCLFVDAAVLVAEDAEAHPVDVKEKGCEDEAVTVLLRRISADPEQLLTVRTDSGAWDEVQLSMDRDLVVGALETLVAGRVRGLVTHPEDTPALGGGSGGGNGPRDGDRASFDAMLADAQAAMTEHSAEGSPADALYAREVSMERGDRHDTRHAEVLGDNADSSAAADDDELAVRAEAVALLHAVLAHFDCLLACRDAGGGPPAPAGGAAPQSATSVALLSVPSSLSLWILQRACQAAHDGASKSTVVPDAGAWPLLEGMLVDLLVGHTWDLLSERRPTGESGTKALFVGAPGGCPSMLAAVSHRHSALYAMKILQALLAADVVELTESGTPVPSPGEPSFLSGVAYGRTSVTFRVLLGVMERLEGIGGGDECGRLPWDRHGDRARGVRAAHVNTSFVRVCDFLTLLTSRLVSVITEEPPVVPCASHAPVGQGLTGCPVAACDMWCGLHAVHFVVRLTKQLSRDLDAAFRHPLAAQNNWLPWSDEQLFAQDRSAFYTTTAFAQHHMTPIGPAFSSVMLNVCLLHVGRAAVRRLGFERSPVAELLTAASPTHHPFSPPHEDGWCRQKRIETALRVRRGRQQWRGTAQALEPCVRALTVLYSALSDVGKAVELQREHLVSSYLSRWCAWLRKERQREVAEHVRVRKYNREGDEAAAREQLQLELQRVPLLDQLLPYGTLRTTPQATALTLRLLYESGKPYRALKLAASMAHTWRMLRHAAKQPLPRVVETTKLVHTRVVNRKSQRKQLVAKRVPVVRYAYPDGYDEFVSKKSTIRALTLLHDVDDQVVAEAARVGLRMGSAGFRLAKGVYTDCFSGGLVSFAESHCLPVLPADKVRVGGACDSSCGVTVLHFLRAAASAAATTDTGGPAVSRSLRPQEVEVSRHAGVRVAPSALLVEVLLAALGTKKDEVEALTTIVDLMKLCNRDATRFLSVEMLLALQCQLARCAPGRSLRAAAATWAEIAARAAAPAVAQAPSGFRGSSSASAPWMDGHCDHSWVPATLGAADEALRRLAVELLQGPKVLDMTEADLAARGLRARGGGRAPRTVSELRRVLEGPAAEGSGQTEATPAAESAAVPHHALPLEMQLLSAALRGVRDVDAACLAWAASAGVLMAANDSVSRMGAEWLERAEGVDPAGPALLRNTFTLALLTGGHSRSAVDATLKLLSVSPLLRAESTVIESPCGDPFGPSALIDFCRVSQLLSCSRDYLAAPSAAPERWHHGAGAKGSVAAAWRLLLPLLQQPELARAWRVATLEAPSVELLLWWAARIPTGDVAGRRCFTAWMTERATAGAVDAVEAEAIRRWLRPPVG